MGRDVTAIQTMEKKYRRVRYWFISSFLLLGLLASAIFIGYPYFSKGVQTMDVKKQELRNQLAKDYFLLKSLLVDHFGKSDRSKTSRLMQDFFDIQETNTIPYTGLVLLDKERRVFDNYSIKGNKSNKGMVGSSYAGIVFQEIDDSIHRVLTLYRTDKEHPMGYKGTEIAFEMSRDNQPLGWLVFQMNVDLLKKTYKIDEKGLKAFQFKGK